MYIPASLPAVFADLASPHTAVDLECGGTLWGVACDDGSFKITTLVLPPQSPSDIDINFFAPLDAASDSPELNAMAAEVQQALNARGLVIGGWIHTHPTQTCFLSSVDLHCQVDVFGDLSGLPANVSRIALVVAPLHTIAAYVMTDAGTSSIRSCSQGQTFHLHKQHEHVSYDSKADSPPWESAWYVDGFRSGYAVPTDESLRVVDLRGWNGDMSWNRHLAQMMQLSFQPPR
jgi:STAM-binding protein